MNPHCCCGSTLPYGLCCGAYIDQGLLPETPEALMRSRYTAYHDVNLNYIAATMKPPASLDFDPASAREWAKQNKWVKLTVLHSSMQDHTGTVEFIAYYQHKNKIKQIHEISEFRRDEGKWFYIQGQHER